VGPGLDPPLEQLVLRRTMAGSVFTKTTLELRFAEQKYEKAAVRSTRQAGYN